MNPFTSEQILAVLTGVLMVGCNKSAEIPKPEPTAADKAPAAATSAAPAANVVNAKEVPSAAGSAAPSKSGKEMGCAPGGCAPGKCGAKE